MRRTVVWRLVPVFVFLAAPLSAVAATLSSPYRPAASPETAARLAAEGQEGLDLDARALAALRDGTDSIVEIDAFPVAPGETARLRLSRFDVVAPDAKIIVEGKNGRTTMPMPPVKDFRGIIEGEPDSTVYVGVASDMAVAWVHSKRGKIYVGPNEAKSGFVVRNANSPLNAAAQQTSWRCDQENLPQRIAPTTPASASATPETPMIAGYKQAMVDVETDNQLYVFFGNDAGTTPGLIATYAHTLYGADNVIYDRDVAMHLTVQNVHVWAVADPYVGPDTASQLLQLGDWWHTNMPLGAHPRTLVHYLSGHPVSGGIGWVGVLCTPDFAVGSDWGGAYSLTQVFGTYPLQIWDIDATSHEQGHNSGAIHTHCMGPPEGYADWTDQCYSGDPGPPQCYVGPTSVPPELGTIMSYCHLLPPGYFDNVILKFHTRSISDYLLPEINGAACLASPATFTDVPTTNPFFHYVETVYQVGVTGGCSVSPLMYCPNNSVTRQQMAVFLMKSEHGSSYVPPACTTDPFPDVPCSSNYAPWIQQLVTEGITGGCGSGLYCPTDPVLRQQMAVFLLKTEHIGTPGYAPPACTPPGPFPDVPCSSNFAPWIQQLVAEAITGGCAGGNYCPTSSVTRAQMAVFLTKTFNLGW